MSTAIGRAALVLSTNSAAMKTGLDKAGADARDWAGKTSSAINGRLVGAAAGALTGVLGLSKAVETLDEVARGGAAARAFNLTAEQFTGMAAVAKSVGEDQREFIESLVTLGKVASEGAAGKGEVATAWFQSLNLNAAEFKGLRLDEQFFTVFEALSKIQDPAERVRALMVAFGEDGGKYLLPLLSKSSGEIRGMAKSWAVSTEQVERATRANLAITQAGVQLRQAWRGIVVALAPVAEFLANELTRTVEQFRRMDVLGTHGLTKILRITGQLIDATKTLTGVTLTLLGVRLKFAALEVGYHAAIATARTGVGAAVAAPVGAAAAAAFEASGLGQRFREVGTLVYDMGRTLLADAGNATKRAEAFAKEVEARKPAAAVAAQAAAATAAAVAVAELKKYDNQAVLRGSAADVSARIRSDFGGKIREERMLEEQRKATGVLRDIDAGVKKLDRPPVQIGAV